MSYFQNIILSYFQNIFLLYLCVDLAQKGRKIAVRHLNAWDTDIAIKVRLKKQHNCNFGCRHFTSATEAKDF